jgi:hypothetical protein
VNNAVARVAGLIAIAVIGVAASGTTGALSTDGFHTAMLITGALLCVGGSIGGIGLRNARDRGMSWRGQTIRRSPRSRTSLPRRRTGS